MNFIRIEPIKIKLQLLIRLKNNNNQINNINSALDYNEYMWTEVN